MPQKGDSTVQSLNKLTLLCTTVAHGPDSVEQLRSPTRSSTSEVEVPQIQSSTELNDNFEAKGMLFRRILSHFSDSPERG